MEDHPFIFRHRDHHPPVGARDFVGQIVARNLGVCRLLALNLRRAAFTVLSTLYETIAMLRANNAALG